MQDEIKHLKQSIKLLLKQNAELANRIVKLEIRLQQSCVDNINKLRAMLPDQHAPF